MITRLVATSVATVLFMSPSASVVNTVQATVSEPKPASVNLTEEVTVKEKASREKTVVSRSSIRSKDDYKVYALKGVLEREWSEWDFVCLVKLWDKESHWNPKAHNSSSGAHGIPQALPAEKMASAGDDYMWNPATQIDWGLEYIEARYGSPCAAWDHSVETGWY